MENFANTVVAFKYFDTNQDNRITFNEFKIGVQGLGMTVSAGMLQDIFREVDKAR
jgi:Ca2+-binding EF-hand superfamily protein